MGAKENGLTLEGLAQRLETLERENAELRRELAAPRDPSTRLSDLPETSSLVPRHAGEGASGFEGQVSRKALLGKAGAAAVAAMAAGMLLNPREARAEDIDTVVTHLVYSEANARRLGPGWTAIWGKTNSDVDPAGRFINPGGTGVWGSSEKTGYSGVYGQHTGSGYGVVGDGTGGAAGVLGRNGSGEGVRGQGRGLTSAGVIGSNPTGDGVRGEGVNGVHGKGSGGGTGVFGEGTNGYAGAFSGGKAQLRIVPKAGVGRPTSGSFDKGDVYMDSAANLFVCVASTIGTSAARWVQVRTVAVS